MLVAGDTGKTGKGKSLVPWPRVGYRYLDSFTSQRSAYACNPTDLRRAS